jgi:hypothetical protein
MRKLNFALVAAFLVFGMTGSLFAQARAQAEITRADIQADRQALVASNLPLTDEQAKAFWPLYREYRAEMENTGDKLMNLIADYGEQYKTLNDEQAADLMNRYLQLQKEVVGVKHKFAPRFKKILPAKTVLRFYQIENKMDTIVMMAVATQIPLAK